MFRRSPSTFWQQAKDLLYVHDTFAIFTDALGSVRIAWEELRRTMVASPVRVFEKAVLSATAEANDSIRRAAKIADGRSSPPTPEMLLLGLRRGFAAAFGMLPAKQDLLR